MQVVDDHLSEGQQNQPGVRVRLNRWPSRTTKARSVLLLHGGNTNARGFCEPNGGVARYLSELAGFDVWLLDWRCSADMLPLRLTQQSGVDFSHERSLFTLDEAALADLPWALREIRARIPRHQPISIFGHCLGGTLTSMALARGALNFAKPLSSILCTTASLFLVAPWQGWLKAESHLIEHLLATAANSACARAIHPHDQETWPELLQQAFNRWPATLLPEFADCEDHQLLRNLSFLFGQPYFLETIDQALLGGPLQELFGPMHLGLFHHVSQSVRRGYVAPMDSPDIIDWRPDGSEALAPPVSGRTSPVSHPLGHYFQPDGFSGLRVTLMTGSENQLWHRRSIDRMHEWLRRHHSAEQIQKQVFRGYGHQELLWGNEAPLHVYPAIAAALE